MIENSRHTNSNKSSDLISELWTDGEILDVKVLLFPLEEQVYILGLWEEEEEELQKTAMSK